MFLLLLTPSPKILITLWRHNLRPIRLIHDIPATILSPAPTRTPPIPLQFVSVVVGKFFPLLNVPQGDNPDVASNHVGCTVRVAGVVDIPGKVFRGITVDGIVSIEEKHVDIP